MRTRITTRIRPLAAAVMGVMLAAAAATAFAAGDVAPAAASLAKLLVGLVGVVAAVLIFSRVLSRLNFMPKAHERFQVLASLPVGQRERIVLMQAGDRQIVVGVAPGRVNTLHVLDEPLDITTSRLQGHGTEAPWLQRVLGGKA